MVDLTSMSPGRSGPFSRSGTPASRREREEITKLLGEIDSVLDRITLASVNSLVGFVMARVGKEFRESLTDYYLRTRDEMFPDLNSEEHMVLDFRVEEAVKQKLASHSDRNQMDMMELQNQQQEMQQIMSTISSIVKMHHDTGKSMLSNLR